MLEVIALIVALGFLLFFNYLLVGDIRYPAVLQALVWVVTLILYLLAQDRFLSLSNTVLILIILSSAAFTFGSFLALQLFSHRTILRRELQPLRLDSLSSLQLVTVVFLTLVGAAGAVVYAQQATVYASTGPTRDLAFNLRYLLSSEGAAPPRLMQLTAYALPLLNTLVGLVLIYFRTTRDRRSLFPLAIAFLAALAMSVFSSGRGIVLFLIIEVTIIYAMTSRKVSLRLVVVSILSFLLVFYLGGSLLGKGISKDGSFISNISELFDSLIGYMVSGTVALSVQLPFLQADGGGRYVFRTFYAVGSALGYRTEVVPLVQSYTYVPEPTNVYTMYLQYLKDFGIGGAVGFQFIFGIIHASLYTLYLRYRHPILLFWIAILSFPLITQPFTDGYLSLLTTWFQYLVISTILTMVLFRLVSKTHYHESASPL